MWLDDCDLIEVQQGCLFFSQDNKLCSTVVTPITEGTIPYSTYLIDHSPVGLFRANETQSQQNRSFNNSC